MSLWNPTVTFNYTMHGFADRTSDRSPPFEVCDELRFSPLPTNYYDSKTMVVTKCSRAFLADA